MKGITIWNVKNLLDHAFTCTVRSGDTWVPCRPIGRTDIPNRIKALWMVLTGKADVVVWPADQ
jgi:hypothetical protein